MTRPILNTLAIGGVLVLLCACAQQEQLTRTPEGIGLVARTAVPTHVLISSSSPNPRSWVEPGDELLAPTATATGPGLLGADLAIQALPGETSVYTLAVRNLGPAAATGIVITDALPSSVTLLWARPGRPVCRRQERGVGCDLGDLQAGSAVTVSLNLAISGSESLISGIPAAGVTVTLSVPVCAIDQHSGSPLVICRLRRLPPGDEAQVQVGFSVDSPRGGVLIHSATVTADGLDPDGSNNRATVAMAVAAVEPVSATAVPTTTGLLLQADGPASVAAGQPFTYTYTVINRGASGATGVWFEDIVPSDLNLVAYTPALPRCEQRGDAVTCTLRDPEGGETVTFTLGITGHGRQPMQMSLDPLLPGWPICSVLKERTWLHILQCQLGELKPGQATRVQLVLVSIGVAERTTVNTAAVHANEADQSPVVITSTMTTTIHAGAEPSRP